MTESIFTEDMGAKPKTRTTFLTVICVLTFISCGWGLIQSLWSLCTLESQKEKTQKQIEQIEQMGDGSFANFSLQGAEYGMQLLENIPAQILLIAFLGIELLGTIWMWQLRKKGFYLYVLSNILLLLFPLIFAGLTSFTTIILAIGGVFTALFIVLYALNLKHMS